MSEFKINLSPNNGFIKVKIDNPNNSLEIIDHKAIRSLPAGIDWKNISKTSHIAHSDDYLYCIYVKRSIYRYGDLTVDIPNLELTEDINGKQVFIIVLFKDEIGLDRADVVKYKRRTTVTYNSGAGLYERR